jgi:hypothetical protein
MKFISELQSLQPELQEMVQRKVHTSFHFSVRDQEPWDMGVGPLTPDRFVRISLKAGRLLEQIPDLVTRISGPALAEKDPVKRWFRLLLDFQPGMIFWGEECYPAYRVDPRNVGSRLEGRFFWAAQFSLVLIERLALWWEESHQPNRQVRTLKRGTRAAKIDMLTEEMIAHLQAAKAHADSSMDFGRAPELLPRPSQKDLADRTGLTPSDVSRCLRDPSARELQILWKTALNLRAILEFNGLASRQKVG